MLNLLNSVGVMVVYLFLLIRTTVAFLPSLLCVWWVPGQLRDGECVLLSRRG